MLYFKFEIYVGGEIYDYCRSFYEKVCCNLDLYDINKKVVFYLWNDCVI